MRTRYRGYTDIQETVSFAQQPGGSDCKSRQYRWFLKRNLFRLEALEYNDSFIKVELSQKVVFSRGISCPDM